MSSTADGLVVAAPRSGSGKTIVAIGLQRAFVQRGERVAAAKTGPDYLDPGFHVAACGRPSVNLDGFAMDDATVRGLASHAAADAGLLVVEGAMGLYDGAAGGARGSCAGIAATLGLPVVLVLDAAGSAQSLAALALGLARYPGAPRIAGAIVNRVASARHGRMIADGFARIDVPLLGLVPRDARLALPSRHLGLVQARETATLDAAIDGIAETLADACDLDAIREAATPVMPAPLAPPLPPPGQRIAVARDDAFGFLYPHLLDGWRRAGAEIAFFSPLADEPPPDGCDACWLPGGYPELHAGRIAAAGRFLDGLRRFASGRAVHGECGGYMTLGRTLTDADGVRHAMAGLLPVETSFATRRLTLGYRRVRWRAAMPFAAAGTIAFGHEHHHATIVGDEGEPIADAWDGEGAAMPPLGSRAGMVTGSFLHVIA